MGNSVTNSQYAIIALFNRHLMEHVRDNRLQTGALVFFFFFFFIHSLYTTLDYGVLSVLSQVDFMTDSCELK